HLSPACWPVPACPVLSPLPLHAALPILATVTTPNHFEAEQLPGMTISNLADMKDAAKKIHDTSGVTVLAKGGVRLDGPEAVDVRSEEHTSELQSRFDLVCRLLLEKKKKY